MRSRSRSLKVCSISTWTRRCTSTAQTFSITSCLEKTSFSSQKTSSTTEESRRRCEILLWTGLFRLVVLCCNTTVCIVLLLSLIVFSVGAALHAVVPGVSLPRSCHPGHGPLQAGRGFRPIAAGGHRKSPARQQARGILSSKPRQTHPPHREHLHQGPALSDGENNSVSYGVRGNCITSVISIS